MFDYFHLGHLRMFKQAKELGDYLIVAIQDGEYIRKYKPDTEVLYNTEERKELIEALSIVDEVIVYTDVDTTIKTIDFDVFARGEDQHHSGFINASDYAENLGKCVVILKRTRGISSTRIRKLVYE